jgi:hypothetical protein
MQKLKIRKRDVKKAVWTTLLVIVALMTIIGQVAPLLR